MASLHHHHRRLLLHHPTSLSSCCLLRHLKPLSSSSSSSSSFQTPPPTPLHGPSHRRGRAPPHPSPSQPFARTFDVAALRVPAAACAALERRLRGHLLNWPRVRNVARLPSDDPSPIQLLSATHACSPFPAASSPVMWREKLVREFDARGFVRFPNLARMSRPVRKRRQGDEVGRGWKEKVYVVEVVGEGEGDGDGEGEEDEWKGLVGEEGFGRGRWRGGPTRLLLLDERYAKKGVHELPEAVKVVHFWPFFTVLLCVRIVVCLLFFLLSD